MTDAIVTHPFPPVADQHSRILILGTMPSVQSREQGFYYGHPRNRFWAVLAACLNQPLPQTIEQKTHLLLSHGIALWDVLASCQITGSDDASIRQPRHNNILELITGKSLARILCNGKKAYNLCRPLNLPLPILCLPSTSPANAAWNTQRLITAWQPALTEDQVQ